MLHETFMYAFGCYIKVHFCYLINMAVRKKKHMESVFLKCRL